MSIGADVSDLVTSVDLDCHISMTSNCISHSNRDQTQYSFLYWTNPGPSGVHVTRIILQPPSEVEKGARLLLGP